MIPIIFAAIPFLVRLLYLGRFRFRSALGRPIRYQRAKKLLDWTVLVMVGGAAYALITNGGRWLEAVILVVVCLVVEHIARFLAYRRAVNEVALHLDFLPEGRDRDRVAMEEVDSQIASRDRM